MALKRQPETYSIVYVRGVDGDTLEAYVVHRSDTWVFGELMQKRKEFIRLLGVDTPERGEPGWKECSDWTARWCLTNINPASMEGSVICHAREKYGRLFGEVWGASGRSLVADMLADDTINHWLIQKDPAAQIAEAL